MLTSWKQCCSTARNIKQGIHTFYAAYAHRVTSVSTNSRMNQPRHEGFGKMASNNENENHPGDIGHGLSHRPFPEHIHIVTLCIDLSYHPWLVHITYCTSSLIFQHHICPAHNGYKVLDKVLPVSAVAVEFFKRHWSSHIDRRFFALLSCYWAWTSLVTLGLQKTISNIGCSLITYNLSCIRVSLRPAWPSCIAFGLHKMDIWHDMSPSDISFSLHIIVSRH